ncbi:hypothetical protein BU24DRAFT_473698 [Aaosphaeria arxii CBS 175.79]|uniref:Uncharacterized protein n=1 Tax=Aaosphaeria arxii CBS 175.79 TaxID=1450172 RepID=A0A6A5X9S8_9PLEO|nr:uncharacterized protein BU24DRAFT_473698 [Aaosphaeria arxii CBS 175.79]KAF2009527.1 hypothetical protein BU24DRAFT_473698 [Aaosphaeria arxii CBS 175.79]
MVKMMVKVQVKKSKLCTDNQQNSTLTIPPILFFLFSPSRETEEEKKEDRTSSISFPRPSSFFFFPIFSFFSLSGYLPTPTTPPYLSLVSPPRSGCIEGNSRRAQQKRNKRIGRKIFNPFSFFSFFFHLRCNATTPYLISLRACVVDTAEPLQASRGRQPDAYKSDETRRDETSQGQSSRVNRQGQGQVQVKVKTTGPRPLFDCCICRICLHLLHLLPC